MPIARHHDFQRENNPMPNKPENDAAQLEIIVTPPPPADAVFSSGQPQQVGTNETLSPSLPQYLTNAGGLSEIPSTAAFADYLKYHQRPENALLLATVHREETRNTVALRELKESREENTRLKVDNATLTTRLDHERDFKRTRTLLVAVSSISNAYGLKLITETPVNSMGIIYLGIGMLIAFLSIYAFGNKKT